MAVPIWPLSLPQVPLQTNYKESRKFDVVETEMDEGLKYRAKARISPYEFSCTYIISEAQWDILDNFVTNIIRDGLIGFDFPNPSTGDYVRVSLKPSEEFGRSRQQNSNLSQVILTFRMYRYGNTAP